MAALSAVRRSTTRCAAFRRRLAEGRLLHQDWTRYDTAHAVFRPKHMSPDELEEGYARCYERLFTLSSIWRRRPSDRRAVLPYLATSVLYKRLNPVWHRLIRLGLTATAWRPLVTVSRLRHLGFRKRLTRERRSPPVTAPVPAGV